MVAGQGWITARQAERLFRAALFGSLAVMLGCGSSRKSSTTDETGGAGPTTSGGSPLNSAGSSSPGGAMTSSSGGLDLANGGSVPAVTEQSCAADLQSIVDQDGAVLTQCPTDQGCSQAQCVPACDAAASSKGSIGCDFWALDSPFFRNGLGTRESGPCYAVFLANAWSRPAKISVSRAGKTLDVAAFARIPRGTGKAVRYEPLPAEGLPAKEVAVLFLSHDPLSNNLGNALTCPIRPAIEEDAAIPNSGRGAAFHIVSDTPLSAYDILPYGGATSYLPGATLLLPSTAWGTNYIALAPPNRMVPMASIDVIGEVWTAVVAREDGTKLRVAPRVSLPGSASLAPALAGEVTEYTLAAGEAIQWIDSKLPPENIDSTGTVFQADKPVSLWTGNTYLSVASASSPDGGAGDSVHQQLTPISALGNEYVGGGIVTRLLVSKQAESVPYRLLGVVNGTELSWDPAPSPSAPLTLNEGEAVNFETSQLFSVRSQDAEHPFVVTQYMPGPPRPTQPEDCQGFGFCLLGDEDWTGLIPTAQFLNRYVFFSDPSYATTNLVVTRRRGPAGFADVQVECLGTISGFRPVGSGGLFEVAHVDLLRDGVALGNCDTSRHVATSDLPFGIVVWGTDTNASYGYPAGGSFGPVNAVVIPPRVR